MGFFFPLLFFSILAVGLSLITNRGLLLCIPLVVLLAPLPLFITGLLFDNIAFGFWGEITVCAIVVCFILVKLVLNRKSFLKELGSLFDCASVFVMKGAGFKGLKPEVFAIESSPSVLKMSNLARCILVREWISIAVLLVIIF